MIVGLSFERYFYLVEACQYWSNVKNDCFYDAYTDYPKTIFLLGFLYYPRTFDEDYPMMGSGQK